MLTGLNTGENKPGISGKKSRKPLPVKEIRKILVPVDFSECSAQAFHFAEQLADVFLAEIFLVHVIHVPVIDEHMPATMVTELIEGSRITSEAQLQKFAAQTTHKNAKLQTSILLGFVADSIVEFADEHEVDLIIMGTQGMNSMGDKLFGTVSWNTIKHAHIPVLTVPAGTEVLSIKNILIPFEGTDKDIEAISYLLHLAGYFGATLYGLHFIVNNYVMNKTLVDKMQTQFRKEIESGRLVFHFISEKNITDGILKFVQQNNIDLVSMITYHRGLVATIFHMSICRFVSTHMNFPLLAFNADK